MDYNANLSTLQRQSGPPLFAIASLPWAVRAKKYVNRADCNFSGYIFK
jgi:hypothetical protein